MEPFIRFLILFEGYKIWDMVFLGHLLLTKPHFFRRCYPETTGVASLKHDGLNAKSQWLKPLVIFPVLAASLATIGIEAYRPFPG